MADNLVNNNKNDAVHNKAPPLHHKPSSPFSEKKFPSSIAGFDLLLRLTKAALTLCLVLSVSLVILATLFDRPASPDPARLISFQHTGPNSSSSGHPNPGPTLLSHIAFGLSGTAKTWPARRIYSDLWWNNNNNGTDTDTDRTRGFVWLDEHPNPNYTWPENSPPYKVSTHYGSDKRASDRMARILKETFQQGLPGVRWFVMGDDDTVFFTHNLVTVLSKYDHRSMYFIGGTSESVEQDEMHGFDTGFGGAGFAVSYPLATELVRILDGCIERYHHFYGSDEKVTACVSELGVPLTREPGFHQIDVREDPYGLLAAHPVAPLVSLHHLDYVKPLFPGITQVDSLKRLMNAYHVDPGHILQQSFCYDHRHKWSVSVSWGYTAQLYPSLVASRVLSTPLQTFLTWRSWKDGPFVFNTRPLKGDPCEQPIIYYLDHVQEVGGGKTVTTYKRVAATEDDQKCNHPAYKHAMSVKQITVSASKTRPDKWMKAPRRECCEITDSRNVNTNMRVRIRSCRAGESITT